MRRKAYRCWASGDQLGNPNSGVGFTFVSSIPSIHSESCCHILPAQRENAMRKMSQLWREIAVFAALLACGVSQAQTFRGIILGTVTDSSGASVSGATVTVK